MDLSHVRRRCAIAIVATLCLTVATPAQSVVRGVVSAPRGTVAGAQVMLEPAAAPMALTDSAGRFQVSAGSGGRFRLLVRAIGYFPISRSLVLATDDTIHLVLELQSNAQELSAVVVEGARRDWASEEFETRRRAGIGRFFPREVLAEQEHSTVTNALRRSAGIQFVKRPVDCGGGWAAAGGRSGAIERQPWMSCINGVPFPKACYFNVFLDGLPIWVHGTAEPPNLDAYNVASLEAIEVYRSAAEAPILFQRSRSTCGVVVLWTRRPGSA
ncbi:MAG: carboxypeptidase-like regulatory domain-containing protein [Gemmatimonadetes bacterium]|nr:carboxypeptidase-like regulatory domain-containing protein [Gemmatimonadota bacterium]